MSKNNKMWITLEPYHLTNNEIPDDSFLRISFSPNAQQYLQIRKKSIKKKAPLFFTQTDSNDQFVFDFGKLEPGIITDDDIPFVKAHLGLDLKFVYDEKDVVDLKRTLSLADSQTMVKLNIRDIDLDTGIVLVSA